MMQVPELVFAFEARVSVSPAIEAGNVDGGRRRIIPIRGGVVEGPRLNGTVIPGGADWQIVRGDGLIDLTARYTIRADDGTLIGVVNRGYRHAPPEVLARLAAGETVDPAQVYFRTTPRFEAPQGPHHWLTRHIFVATAGRHPAGVQLRFFQLT
jgi:hypothetical protein